MRIDGSSTGREATSASYCPGYPRNVRLDEIYHWGRHDALKLKNVELMLVAIPGSSNVKPALRQQVLNIAIAQCEAKVEPNCVPD